jgi:DNA-binding transcriptional LysR family regulator
LIPTVTARLLAPALGQFLTEAPNVAVRVQEGYSAALTQMVRAGDLDLAIVPAFGGTPGVRRRRFLRTRETLVTGAGRGAEPGAPVRLADLGPLRLVLPGAANTRRRTIETYCADQGVTIAQSVELDAMLGALDFVARSDWVAILPEVMLDGAAGRHGLSVHPIVSPDLHLDLMLIEPSRRPISAPAARFVDLLRDAALRCGSVRSAEGPVRLVAQGS